MATQTVRWGVIGAAAIAIKRVIPAIQASSNGRVTAIAARDPRRAHEAARGLNIATVYDDYEALLADPEIDAIYNPLPNSLHAAWSQKAAEAGKAILCEKPLARNAAEAAALADVCARHGVLVMEAFMYRFHPRTLRVRELIEDGAIGEVRQVRASFCFSMGDPDPTNVRLQPGLAGGALMDIGCYAVNAARMLLGTEPTKVVAVADVDERFGVDMAMVGALEFPGGRLAAIDCSFKAGFSATYSAIGTKGRIDVPRAFQPEQDDVPIIIDADGLRTETIPGTNQYVLMAEQFAKAVLEGAPSPYPIADSVANMHVLDALAAAARS